METRKTPIEIATSLAIIIVVAVYFWQQYGPIFGEYELKKGHFACSNKDDVVVLRGARLLGVFATIRAISSTDCRPGPFPVVVKRLARHGNLIHRLEIDGRTWYADHDAIKRID